jgi:hypothetical protein
LDTLFPAVAMCTGLVPPEDEFTRIRENGSKRPRFGLV